MELEPREDDVPAEANGDDDSYGRRARTLIYVVAAGFIVVGGLSLAAYLLKCKRQHLDVSIWHCLSSSIPLVIGVAILIMSSSLARAIEEYLDE